MIDLSERLKQYQAAIDTSNIVSKTDIEGKQLEHKFYKIR